ncbi:MAG: MATE family efflux transporter [Myxococcales bacterium]|nr:MATE family efflux transporter [Myxococcales bacterium]
MLTRTRVLGLAWPIVLAQMATAFTGVVDTAVMGSVGTRDDLGAVALASVTFSFVYWGFGFLRMATTGLTAQAEGAGQVAESRAVLVRSLLVAGALGLGCMVMLPVIEAVALGLFQATEPVEALAGGYIRARIWGAPAALMGFGITGWLLGRGRTRELLLLQVVLNGVNAGLDSAFVGVLGHGPAGIGMGTAMAEWLALGLGLWLVRDGLTAPGPLWDRDRLVAMFTANRDILVRTLALLAGFAWFVNAGALVGPDALAGNQVLLQLVTVAAFVLDAFAFVAEKEAGEAVGAGDRARLARAIRMTSELALVSGAVFSLGFLVVGGPLIGRFVADVGAREAALAYLPFCAAVPLLGVPAFQLDGVFLGATRGRALRNAALVSTVVYIALDLALRSRFGNTGVWTAFLAMYVLRAGTLAIGLPALLSSVRPAQELG